MIWPHKKSRELEKMLDRKPVDKRVADVVSGIMDNKPSEADPRFAQDLKNKLLAKHQAMTKDKTEKKEQKNSFWADLRVRGWATALGALVILVLAGVLAYPLIPAPTVRGYVLKGASRNISVNAPLKITFDQLMDNASVEKAFRVKPETAGKLEWQGNSMYFRPDQPLKIGETYQVTIGTEATSLLRKPLPTEYSEYYKVVAAPRVVLLTPNDGSTEIPADAQINIMFDRPMTGLTTLEGGRERFPEIRIEPAVRGQFKWLGTSTLQFRPEKLAAATTYTVTVPKGTSVLDGGYTEEEFVSTFETARPVVLDMLASDTQSNYRISPGSNFVISFNQKIDLVSAGDNIKLHRVDDNKNAVEEVTVRYFTLQDWKAQQQRSMDLLEMNTYEEIPLEEDSADSKAEMERTDAQPEPPTTEELAKMLVVTPKQAMKAGSNYFLEVRNGLKSAEGPLTTLEDRNFDFRVMDQFKLLTAVNDGENSEDLARVLFTYSNPVDLRSLRGKISITPERRDEDGQAGKPLVYSYGEGEVEIDYDFLPSTDYTVTIAPGVKDILGNVLDQPGELKFTSKAYKPSLTVETGTDLSVLDSNKESLFYLKSVNADYADVRLKKLTPEQFAELYFDGYIDYRSIEMGRFGGPDHEARLPIELGFNNRGHSPLNLDKLSGNKLGSGFYYMEISNPNVTSTVCLYEWETDKPGCHEEMQVLKNLFIVSGTSLALKSSLNELVVWATDLHDGRPLSGQKIRVLDRGRKQVAESETDLNGVATLKLPPAKEDYWTDYLVFGERENDVAFVHSSWSEGIAPWNFNISNDQLAPEYYTYFYTDRPIYRPAQEVYFKGIVRQEKDYRFRLPDVKKVRVTVDDPNGNEIYNQELALSANGTFADKFMLGADIATGDFYLRAELLDVPGPEWLRWANASFKVYEYRKPEYKLDLTSDREDYVNGQTAKIDVQAAYFFGAPLKDAEIKWTLRAQDYYFFLPEEVAAKLAGSWFSFADEGYFCYWGCMGGSEVVSQGSAKADSSGKAALQLPLNISDKKMSQIYTLEVSVTDANHQSVSNRLSFPVHQGDFYLGIRSFDYIVGTDKPAKFEILAVDRAGKPLSGKQAEVTLYERSWNTVKRKNVDGGYYFENSYDDKEIEKKTVSSDDDGLASVEFAITKGGVYKVQAAGKDGAGNLVKSSTTVYVSSGDFINWGSENNDKIELVTDKMEYRVGDTAKILVKSPYKDVYALVTQERDKVLDYKVVKLQSNSDTIEIPITEKFLPNAFVSVVLVKGSSYDAGLIEPAEGAPDERTVAAFKVGYTTLQVNTESKKLQIEISADKERYAPGEKVKLNFLTKDHSGKTLPAELSVAVVDESVLSLTESVTADLLNVFYRKRVLGVNLAHTLTKALSRINVQVEAGMKGGGGGELAKRGIFKDTAIFQSTLLTGASGEGTLEFQLPDNLTTWQVLAIGISDDSREAKTLVGSNKYSFLATKDILVRPVLPRFLTRGDRMKISALVHNYTDEAQNMRVTLEAAGVEIGDGGAEKTVRVEPKGSRQVDWLIAVGQAGEATLAFTAVANGGERGDSIEMKLPVKEASMPEIVAMGKVLSDNDRQIEQVWLPQGLNTENGSLKISSAATLAGAITEGLDYLVRFPYGCSEQIASAILPNVAVKRLLNTGKITLENIDEKSLDEYVSTGLQQLYKNQQGNGGFGLWLNSTSNAYLTAHVTMAMFEARKAGYTVDQSALDSARKYLTSFLTQKENPAFSLQYRLNTRAFVLYVLAELGEHDAGLLNNLYEQRDQLSLLSRAYLLMAYGLLPAEDDTGSAGKLTALREELENSALQTPRGVAFQERNLEFPLFDTNTRSTAVILKALNRVDSDNPLLPKIIQSLLRERRGGHFSTTQETAVSLLAMIEYLESSKELSPAFQATVELNGKNVLDTSYTSENLFDVKEVEIPLSDLLPNNLDNELAAQRTGEGRMYYDMNLKYYLPLDQLKAESEGLEVLQEYYDIDDQKLESPLESIQVGQNIHGRLTVIVPEDRHYVMIEDFLPAGLEGIDFNLKTSEQFLVEEDSCDYYCPGSWYFNHSEVRDDRMMYFADYLPRGVYELDYYLRATSVGEFADLPALAQETYFPEVFGRSAGKFFRVTE